LIAVVSNSRDPGRWQDSAALFNYGFNNYGHVDIQEALAVLGEIYVHRPQLQEPETMEYFITEPVDAFLRHDQKDRIVKDITFTSELLVDDPEHIITLRTPIEEGQVLGRVTYSVDGEILYTGFFTAARDAGERTFATDVDHYWEIVSSALFSREAIPYWIIAFLLLIILSYIIYRIVRIKKSSYSYKRLFK